MAGPYAVKSGPHAGESFSSRSAYRTVVAHELGFSSKGAMQTYHRTSEYQAALHSLQGPLPEISSKSASTLLAHGHQFTNRETFARDLGIYIKNHRGQLPDMQTFARRFDSASSHMNERNSKRPDLTARLRDYTRFLGIRPTEYQIWYHE